ncbi:MAG: DKNYY domain-containing protein [Pseudoxanthomonas sp.]|nr:DKNYY domain-containing protein [Pseudoxanthomonas sp.]
MPARPAATITLLCALLTALLASAPTWPQADAAPVTPGSQPVGEPDPDYRRNWRGQPYWCRGGNCLAHGRRRMSGADPSSFRPLTGGYAVDRHRVWFEGREVEAGDPATWRVLAPGFARDHRHVHVGGHAVPGLDPDRTRYLPRHYLADDRQALYGEFQNERPFFRRLADVDADRLALLPGFSDVLATDGARLYVAGERVPLDLEADFRPLWSGGGIGLAFASGGRLHLLSRSSGVDPRSLAHRVPARRQDRLLSLQVSWQGDGHWGLADGHLLVVAHQGDLLVLREGVSELRHLPDTPFHAVVDGHLLFRHPNRPPELTDLGPAQEDLRVIDAWVVKNGGSRWNGGAPDP